MELRHTHLVERHCTAKAEQAKLESRGLDERCRSLIKDGEVVDLVLAGAELFHNAHVLNQAPDGEHGDREGDSTREKKGELGKREVDRRAVELVEKRGAAGLRGDGKELFARAQRDQRRVLEQVAKNPKCGQY
jgi:hypothetical protein